MKQHYPDVFTCALLNAQPMGFYSPATIVEDAKRQGIEMCPVCVRASHWYCTLEKGACPHFSVRMGLRFVKGLARADGERIVAAREERPFASLDDFVGRVKLDEGKLARLGEAGAFESFGVDRREALWGVRGLVRTPRPDLPVAVEERAPLFAALDEFETIAWDYDATSHSPRGHPLEALRATLVALRLPDARSLNALPDGRRVRYAGVVICRQRPGTASGVVFLTLEDETGFVNIVIWSQIYEEHSVLIKTAAFLGVTGRLQVQDGVTHLIAESFWTPHLTARPRHGGSRDFH